MPCEEAPYAENYYDLMVSYTNLSNEYLPRGCIQPVDKDYEILYLPMEGLPELNALNYTYTAIPKCYTILARAAMEASGITRVQNQPTLSLKGQGILMGFLDTGIDYQHPAFRNSDGTTRIVRIWDQTLPGEAPTGFLYGTEYQKAEIDAALRLDDPLSLVPEQDENGHGTFLAGLAAGSELRENDFTGAAPFSQIIMVKLKAAKQYLKDYYFIPDDAVAYAESDIMTAISYLTKVAEELKRPMVICIGLGSNSGDHGGNNVLAGYLNYVATKRNLAVVVAGGNEVNARHHYYGEIAATEKTEMVEINVEDEMPGFSVEMWSKAPELYQVSVISPTGERVPWIRARRGEREVYRFIFENTVLSIDYRIVGIRTGDQLIYLRFQNPTRGIWSIEVSGEYNINGAYNMWLPISGLIAGRVNFVRSNPDMTITVPGNAEVPMTVAAYDAADDSIYMNSSRGYTVGGFVKPDYAAPGVNVYGPEPNGRFGTRTGSSVSAAVAAGASALYLEWAVERGNNTGINSVEVKNDFVRGAVRKLERSYPNREWGYGTLNLYQTFEQLRST